MEMTQAGLIEIFMQMDQPWLPLSENRSVKPFLKPTADSRYGFYDT